MAIYLNKAQHNLPQSLQKSLRPNYEPLIHAFKTPLRYPGASQSYHPHQLINVWCSVPAVQAVLNNNFPLETLSSSLRLHRFAINFRWNRVEQAAYCMKLCFRFYDTKPGKRNKGPINGVVIKWWDNPGSGAEGSWGWASELADGVRNQNILCDFVYGCVTGSRLELYLLL